MSKFGNYNDYLKWRKALNKQNVSGLFSWKKLLHNFCYWINPFYMLSTDLKNSPKAQTFIVEHFGHILEPIIKWLAKILDKFEWRK